MNDLHLMNFDVHRDAHGVLTAILNVPDQPVNVFNERVLHDLDDLVREVEHDDSIRAVVFRSGKESGFLAGADLHAIESLENSEEAKQICRAGQELFQRLESLPVPTIAVINGVCLGGGLEFVLACRHRILIDDTRTKLGFPEVELGLLPGWGGTQRMPRLVGLQAALPMLLTGKKVGVKEALRIGLADKVCHVSDVDSAIADLLARDTRHSRTRSEGSSLVSRVGQIAGNLTGMISKLKQPRQLVQSAVDHTRLGRWAVLKIARRSIAKNAAHYPALPAILRAVASGLHDQKGVGFGVEREEFAELISTDTHHSLLGLFFQRERARKAETWVHSLANKPRRVRKVGVVGGGAMGAGIAHWVSMQGFDVVLKEVNSDLLDAGTNHIRDLFDESVCKHALTAADAALKLGAITATTEWRDFANVDLVIEAVTERLDIKKSVFRDLELYCPAHAVLVSNTSALSIHALGEAVRDPSRVLGLHFFNPVHRMQLVEIVRTPESHDAEVALLVEFVKKLGKVPLVTTDSPGFVVNRILFPYLDEAVRLHCEGVPTTEIDKALKQFGMPMGPLELLDQVGIDVAAHVADTLNGLSPEPSPTGAQLHEMAAQGQIGRKSGQGFYHYSKESKQKEKPVASSVPVTHVSAEDIRDRVILRLVNEAAKCVQEGVVAEPWMIDLGMVLGTGFAPFLGGPLRMCDLQGYGEAVAKLEYFQKTLGARFAPTQWLIDQIEHHTEHHTM